MERFGAAMTAAVGPTRDLSSTRMTALIERRSTGRTAVSRGVLLFFSSRRGLFGCEVCDVTNVGARIRLNSLNILPPIFELSFDNFRTAGNVG
jgi:hypothetical protein